jgi:hypothetical protein
VPTPTVSPTLTELLATFVSHFKRAIRQEMDVMRERKGSFDIAIAGGVVDESSEAAGGARYTYSVLAPNDKLVAGIECTLRTRGAEYLVRVERVDGSDVTLSSERTIDVGDGQGVLVIYPWFLYEKLLEVLDAINPHEFAVERAMALFGKRDALSARRELVRAHDALNTSQLAAVQLCSDSDLAFVWGPPGTGKTTTLAHIVSELRAQGLRVLILSTTNAALDQALAKVAADVEMAEDIQAGQTVRIGRSDAPTFGAAVREVVIRLNEGHEKALDRLLRRRLVVAAGHQRCENAAQALAAASAPFQESLFDSARPPDTLRQLVNVFGERRAVRLKALPVSEPLRLVRNRSARLSRLRSLCDESIAEHKRALLNKEREAVTGAGLVLSTLTNAYFSPLMQGQRFDVVIVEEASMAVLPALFYAACLGERKTVIVGDPCQLPSIVQSDEEYVRRVMGRNIFEVGVADPGSSPLVAMLDVQYRMHPVIGELVSDLFYFGRLRHGGDMAAREGIAALDPHAGAPLVVVDTVGRTTCQQGAAGQSRFNTRTAELSVDLAVRAAGSGAESVAIITPYVDQARAIRALLKNHGDAATRIECSTVHRFQGQERDVVILDTVDADPMKPGVLLSERGPRSSAQNLINVAISRARGKLIVVADVNYFEQRAPASVVAKMIARAVSVGWRESVSGPGMPGP